jgi:hypothetical protein
MTIQSIRLLATAACLGALCATASAHAQSRPASVVGTWQAFANQSAIVVNITSQGTKGTCRAIVGTVTDTASGGVSNLQGYYCPTTGGFQFLRKDSTTNDTFQTYAGNVAMLGSAMAMAGTFSEDNAVGFLGEYNFAASQ